VDIFDRYSTFPPKMPEEKLIWLSNDGLAACDLNFSASSEVIRESFARNFAEKLRREILDIFFNLPSQSQEVVVFGGYLRRRMEIQRWFGEHKVEYKHGDLISSSLLIPAQVDMDFWSDNKEGFQAFVAVLGERYTLQTWVNNNTYTGCETQVVIVKPSVFALVGDIPKVRLELSCSENVHRAIFKINSFACNIHGRYGQMQIFFEQWGRSLGTDPLTEALQCHTLIPDHKRLQPCILDPHMLDHFNENHNNIEISLQAYLESAARRVLKMKNLGYHVMGLDLKQSCENCNERLPPLEDWTWRGSDRLVLHCPNCVHDTPILIV